MNRKFKVPDNKNMHFVQYNDKYLMLDTNTSRCIAADFELYNGLKQKENLSAEALKEYSMFEKTGYFDYVELDKKELDDGDLIIHEIHLGVQTNCNLACKYCFRHENIKDHHEISLLKALLIIDRTIEVHANNPENTWFFFNVGLTGEVLLDIDYVRAIQKHVHSMAGKSQKSFNCVFNNTNATLLTAEKARDMWNFSHMSGFSISFDGPKEIHDNLRCFPDGRGTYDVIKPLIADCNSKWKTTAEATLTGKMPCVTDIFTHLYEIGFSSICIKPVRMNLNDELAINSNNIDLVEDEYGRFVDFLISQGDEKLIEYISCINQRDFLGRYFYRLFLGQIVERRCNSLVNLIAIDQNGDIFPCASFMGIEEFRLGNIFEDSGEFNMKRGAFLDKFHLNKKQECKECWAENLCGGGCPCSAFVANGHIDAPNEFECRLTKCVIEKAMILLAEVSERKNVLDSLNSAIIHRSPQSVFPIALCKHSDESPMRSINNWHKADIIELNSKEQFRGFGIWKDGARFWGSVAMLWDKKYFYIRVIVTDEYKNNTKDNLQTYDENCVRFSITNTPESVPCEYGIGMKEGQAVLMRLRLQDNTKNWLGDVESAKVDIKFNANSIIYTVAVPWDELKIAPIIGDTFKFNAAIYSRENLSGGKTWFEWSPGIVVENHPRLFGNLEFI